jgi:hypothetical protein
MPTRRQCLRHQSASLMTKRRSPQPTWAGRIRCACPNSGSSSWNGRDAILPIWVPTRHGVGWPPKATLTQEDLEQWTNMGETAEGLNRLPPDSDS